MSDTTIPGILPDIEGITYGTFTHDGITHIAVTGNSYGPYKTVQSRPVNYDCSPSKAELPLDLPVTPGIANATCKACIARHAHNGRPFPGTWVVVVTEHVTVTDHTGYATACNYDKKIIRPGVYALHWTTVGHGKVPAGKRPYYGTATLDAVITDSHITNSLMGYSKDASEHGLARASAYRVTWYEYQFAGMTRLDLFDGKAYAIEVRNT